MQTSALHCAVEGGCPECLTLTLRFLKRYSAEIVGWSVSFSDMLEWKDPMANTPLAVACAKGADIRLIRILLRAGASVDIPNRVTQRTVFMHACEAGNEEAVRLLLAIVKSKREIQQERSVAARSTSSLTSTTNQPPKASFLSTLKCRPAEKDASGVTALMLAAEYGHLEIVKILLRLNISLLSTSFSGNGIFHFAAGGGSREVCEILVEHERQQWNQYKECSKEQSVLQSMCQRPRTMLTRNHRGQQPHQIAAEKGHADVAEYLITTARALYSDKVCLIAGCWNSGCHLCCFHRRRTS
jgi:ankyrin repeat protein